MQEALEKLEPLFKKIVVEQLIFTHEKGVNILAHITHLSTKNKIKAEINGILKDAGLRNEDGSFSSDVVN